MKLRTCLIASTALVAAPAALASDMPSTPQIAEPINYVIACDAYGAGYFQLPGKSTCLKLGGRIRAQVVSGNLSDGDVSDWSSYARGYMWLETQTPTGFGSIYTYKGFYYTWTEDGEYPKLDSDDAYVKISTPAADMTFGLKLSLFDGYIGDSWMQLGGANWTEVYPLQATVQVPVGNLKFGLSVEDSTYRSDTAENFNYIGAIEYSHSLFDMKLSGALVDDTSGKAPEVTFTSEDETETATAKIGSDGDYGYAVNFNTTIRPIDRLSVNFGAQYGVGAYNFTAQGFGSYALDELAGTSDLLAFVPQYVDMFENNAVSLANANDIQSFSVMSGFTYALTENVSFMLEGSYHQWDVGFNDTVPIALSNTGNLETTALDYSADGNAFRVSTSVVFYPDPDVNLGIALAAGYSKATAESTFKTDLDAPFDTETVSHTVEDFRVGTRVQYTF